MQRYDAPCKRDFYPAYRSSGRRDPAAVRLIVMHDEESASARGAAAWFKSSMAQGSAHICVDDKECYRCLPNWAIPWGAPGANTIGFHIEQAGYAAWSSVIWRKHLRTLKRAAYKAAFHCHVFNIPPVFIDAGGLANGRRGITTHAECTKAFGGTHTDPGRGWPRRLFMLLVRRYYRQLEKGV